MNYKISNRVSCRSLSPLSQTIPVGFTSMSTWYRYHTPYIWRPVWRDPKALIFLTLASVNSRRSHHSRDLLIAQDMEYLPELSGSLRTTLVSPSLSPECPHPVAHSDLWLALQKAMQLQLFVHLGTVASHLLFLLLGQIIVFLLHRTALLHLIAP